MCFLLFQVNCWSARLKGPADSMFPAPLCLIFCVNVIDPSTGPHVYVVSILPNGLSTQHNIQYFKGHLKLIVVLK